MGSLVTSLVIFACVFAAAMLGFLVQKLVPKHHVDSETKEVVRQVMGIVGAMTGMVLGLLVASAKSSFDGQRDGVAQLAANIVVLDRALERYGSETLEARKQLKTTATDMIHRMWPQEQTAPEGTPESSDKHARYDDLYSRVLELEPKNALQKTTQDLAIKVMHDTTQMRWLLYSQRSNSMPLAFLILLVAWLAITFGSYALFAPRHSTTVVTLLLGALIVSSAVFLILELDHSFGGVIHISSQPMRNALLQLGS